MLYVQILLRDVWIRPFWAYLLQVSTSRGLALYLIFIPSGQMCATSSELTVALPGPFRWPLPPQFPRGAEMDLKVAEHRPIDTVNSRYPFNIVD